MYYNTFEDDHFEWLVYNMYRDWHIMVSAGYKWNSIEIYNNIFILIMHIEPTLEKTKSH